MAQVLHGNASGNQLNATADKTQVYGLAGNDTLVSDNKSDVLLVGGSGDDSLIMSGGNGTLSGGDGSDTFELDYSAAKSISAVIEDLVPSEDKIVVNFDGNTAPQLTSSISGSDVVWRDGNGNFNLTLKGVRDNDYFDGDTSDEAWEILKLTNDEREKQTATDNISRPLLTMSDGLTKAAEIRVQEITELDEQGILDIYKHERPYNKGGYSTVFDEVGKHYSAYAENITAGESTAAEAMQDWIVSDSHNVNIWNPNYLKLGVGYNHLNIGSHSASQLDYWEQLFGGSLRQTEMETVSTADLLTANIVTDTISKTVMGTDGDDTINNGVFGSTIAALGGNDSITNTGLIVSISGGADNDTIDNRGSFVTINAGTGDDLINLNAAQEVLIQYAAGDGSDTVSGINATDTLSITGGEYLPVTVGNDVVVGFGADSITLTGAARSNVQIVGTRSKLYLGTEGDDTIKTDVNDATIQPLGGNDSITNDGGANVLFVHESGDDTIGGFNDTSTLQIAGGSYDSFASGNDLILRNDADSIKILGAADSTINIVDTNGNPVTVGDAKDIRGTEQADNLSNDLDGATIRAFGGDDTITNSGAEVSIYGGAGNDSVNNNRKHGTVYIYESGDDTIEGFNDSDSLNIGGYSYSTVQSENDILVNVDIGSITLKDYSGQDVNIISSYVPSTVPGESINNYNDNFISIVGTAGDDDIDNRGLNVTINALAGNDTILNWNTSSTTPDNTSINGGAGDDSIDNRGLNVTIDGGAGNDLIQNWNTYFSRPDNSSISGGAGNDSIDNRGVNVTIESGAGNDSILNWDTAFGTSDNTSISSGAGDDYINNVSQNVTIDGGAGNDSIENWASPDSTDNTSVNGGDGDDYIHNVAQNVTIDGGAGNDSIRNDLSYPYAVGTANNTSINGGDGDDYIHNEGTNDTILGGTGDDRISLSSSSRNNFVRYADGDGNDTVWGITENDTLNLLADETLTSSVVSGDDLIINVGTGSILLIGARNKPPKITYGESGTEGGGSGSGGSGSGGSGSGGSGSGGSGGGGRGGNDGGNTSGGTSASEGRGSAASGGRSASGSAGSQTSTGISSGGGRVSRYVSNNRKDSIASAATRSLYNEMTAMNQTTSLKSDYIYTGGNQVISDYTPDKKIFFCEIYTGAFYDGAGNFFAGSSTGALAVENAMDKVIDLRDAAGNDFVKAYAATTAGVIDGRGIAGFELINGSAGADAIYAGDGGSQLWGGADVATDILVGGGGSDIFIISKYQGSDLIVNASSKDVVYLSDANLSDIIATEENNGVVAVAFNTGNVVAVQSSEALSSTFLLNDGSQYRYNHANKSWQTA